MGANRRTAAWCAALALVTAVVASVAGDASAGPRAQPTLTQLGLMVLPRNELGPAAQHLSQAGDSGTISTAIAARGVNLDITPAKLKKLGRITGYTLDFGSALRPGGGIASIQTSVDLYTPPTNEAFAFWKKEAVNTRPITQFGIKATTSPFPVKVGKLPAFGVSAALPLPGEPVIYGAGVYFQRNAVLGSVSVEGSNRAEAIALARAIAPKLATRIDGVLAGRITGEPPVPVNAGPPRPPNGPNLAAVAPSVADLKPARVASQGYENPGAGALASYRRYLSPAGRYYYFYTATSLYDSVLAASFNQAYTCLPISSKAYGKYLGSQRYNPSAVTVKVGDESCAFTSTATPGTGRAVYLTLLATRVGKTVEFVVAASLHPNSHAAVAALAKTVAARAKTGLKTL